MIAVSNVAHIRPTAPNLNATTSNKAKATPKTPLVTDILKNFLLARLILHSVGDSE